MTKLVHAGIHRHVVQRTNNDCAIATVAMAANLPYKDVAEKCPVIPGARGLYPQEVHHLLAVATGVPWHRPRYGWLRPVAQFANTSNPVVAIVCRPWKWHVQHCVAVQGGWIHDPEFPQGCRVEEYPRRHWRTITVLRPESALRLLFVQHFRT